MKLPGTYAFTSADAETHAKLEMLVKEAMEQYNNKIKEKNGKSRLRSRRINSSLQCFFLCTCNSFPIEN